MQRLDEKKRQQITRAATRLFAHRPFHQVRLEDVAAAAKVGKGTVYLYFKSKEEMYRSLIQEGFARFVDGLSKKLAADDTPDPWAALTLVATELSNFALCNPDIYQMSRAVPLATLRTHKRRELTLMVEKIIRRGVGARVMCDPHPELTATFVPAMVRAAMLHGPKDLTGEMLAGQIMRMLRSGLKKGNGKCA